MRKKLNISPPVTYNEKIQWRKLHDKNPFYKQLADKYEVRGFLADTIGEQYLVPLIGVWERFEDIDFDKLPNRFVLKCNHNSGGFVICKDKSKLDIRKVRKKLKGQLRRDYYLAGREFQYKGIKRKIIAEEYIEDDTGSLMDYKIHCFNAIPKIVQVDYDKFTSWGRNLYTPEWEYMDVTYGKPSDKNRDIPKPDKLDEMLTLTNKIAASVGSICLRVDWYIVHNRLYIGEITFNPEGGLERFEPDSYDELLGSWIELR